MECIVKKEHRECTERREERYNTNILIAYGSNEDEKTEKKEEFWNELTDIVENLVGRTIILGDLNGRLGSKYNRTIEVKGRYGEEQKI